MPELGYECDDRLDDRGLTVQQLRRLGRRTDDEELAHISPARSENIDVFGADEVDMMSNSPRSASPAIGRYGCTTLCSAPMDNDIVVR